MTHACHDLISLLQEVKYMLYTWERTSANDKLYDVLRECKEKRERKKTRERNMC